MVDIFVMLVEDEDEIRQTLQSILQYEFKRVESYPDAPSALEAIQKDPPDVIVTDIKMPKMNGLEMVSIVKKTYPEIPFVVTSAFNDSDYLLEAIKLKIENFVVKPIDTEDLINSIQSIASRILLKRELKVSQEIYSNFFENSTSANVVLKVENGPRFNIEYVNKTFESIEGIKGKDIVGKYLDEVFKGYEKSGLSKVFSQVYETGKAIRLPLMSIKYNDQEKWREHFIFKGSEDTIISSYIDRTQEQMLYKKQRENYENTLLTMVELIEHRDTYTAGHSQRVATYSKMVAEHMGLSKDECDKIYKAGILHDIGKISIPDAVLLKPASLNGIEYELIKQHVQNGLTLIDKNPMYHDLKDIIATHHERVDGSGYPLGLKAKEIPIGGKIMAVCDAFDAMTTERIYKNKKNVHQALDELEKNSGVQFDPEVVNSAKETLSDIDLEEHVNQLPKNLMDEQRFAFFFKDQTTGAFSINYLDLLLKRTKEFEKNKCMNVILLHNFSKYNKSYGWKQGDKLLRNVVEKLQSILENGYVFRIHGDDFAILNKEHFELDLEKLKKELELEKYEIDVESVHLNTEEKDIKCVEELEKYLHSIGID